MKRLPQQRKRDIKISRQILFFVFLCTSYYMKAPYFISYLCLDLRSSINKPRNCLRSSLQSFIKRIRSDKIRLFLFLDPFTTTISELLTDEVPSTAKKEVIIKYTVKLQLCYYHRIKRSKGRGNRGTMFRFTEIVLGSTSLPWAGNFIRFNEYI